MSNICKCHGHLTNVQEAAALARKTKRNVPVCLARPAATAFDAHTYDVSAQVKNKIARAKRNAALDAEADREIALLFPALESAVEDNAEEEAEALGLNGEDGKEAQDGDTSFEDALAASAAASKAHWDNVKKRNAERSHVASSSGVYSPVPTAAHNAAKAADAVSTNAKRSRSFSMFSNAASIMKRQKKSA